MIQKLIVIAGLFFGLTASAALTNADKALVTQQNNMLVNPGFESGRGGWDTSLLTITTTAADVYQGAASGVFNATNGSQSMTSSAMAVGGKASSNGVFSCAFKGSASSYTMNVYDGSNVIASKTISYSSSVFVRDSINFIFPSSGSVYARITSAVDEPAVNIDSCFFGSAQDFNLFQVGQASLYGGVRWPGTASCSWSLSSPSGFTSYSADSDCTLPTGSNLFGNATDMTGQSKIPSIYFSSLPPGEYEVTFSGYLRQNAGSTHQCVYQIYDGSTGNGITMVGGNGDTTGSIVIGRFTQLLPGSKTFSLRVATHQGTPTCLVQNTTTPTEDIFITVKRFPSSQETAYRPDLAVQWGGISVTTGANDNPGGTGAWEAVSNASWATKTLLGSATAGTTANELSFKMPYLSAGSYEVVTNYQVRASSSANCHISVYDGTNRVGVATASNGVVNGEDNVNLGAGIITYSSAQTNKEFTIQINGDSTSNCTLYGGLLSGSGPRQFFIKPVGVSTPALLLVGSVTSNSSGLERVERLAVTGGGGGEACNSSPCTITSQSGSWVTSVTRSATGDYAVNIAAGIFSAAPTCTITARLSSTSERSCMIDAAHTTTLLPVYCSNPIADAVADSGFNILCMGPR